MGRYLRLALRLLLLPLVIVLAVVLGTIGYLTRRREEEQREQTHDLVEVAPDENTDDGKRDGRWKVFADMSCLGRLKQVDQWHQQEAAKVVPNEPIEKWAENRRMTRGNQ